MKIVNFRDLSTNSKISAHNWITNSALRSIRELSEDYKNVKEKYYFIKMNDYLNKILELSLDPKNGVEIKIVVDSENTDYFLSYLIFHDLPESKTRRVIYLYTKFPHRREGIAMSLAYKYLQDYNVVYHFTTKHFNRWLESGSNTDHNFRIKKIDRILIT